jgi:hypothetical protein
LKKEIEEDTSDGKTSMFMDWHNSYGENVYTSNATYRFNAMPIRSPRSFFAEIERSILKFIWQNKSLQISKVSLSETSVLEVS